MTDWRWFAIVTLIVCGGLRLDAQTVAGKADEFRYRAGIQEIRDLGDGRYLIILVEAVQIDWQDVWVRADNALIWARTREGAAGESGGLEPLEIYADSNVLFRRGEQSIDCHQIYLDVAAHSGLFVQATLSTRVPTRDDMIRLVVRAEQLQQLSRRRFRGDRVSISASPFAKPGHRLETDWVLAEIDPEKVVVSPGGRPRRNVRYETDSSVFYLGDLPVMVFPPLTGNSASTLGRQLGYIRRFQVDDSGKFGPSVTLGVGDDIFIDDVRWGEWVLFGRYFGDRGFGGGADLEYETDEYRGKLHSVYQNDDGRDRRFGTPTDDDRGRVRWQHRHRLPERIQLDLEFSYLSDIGFLPEYYENEFRSGKEQESLIYLKRAVENRALTFLAKARVNDFMEQVEHLPSVGHEIVSEPLFDIDEGLTVYFDGSYDASHVRRRFPDGSGIPSRRVLRADFDNVVGVPFLAGPVKIEPFAGLRYTTYDSGALTDEAQHRFATQYGVSVTTELSRTWHVFGGLFDLQGLRHIVQPEVTYRVLDHVSGNPRDFKQIDAVDSLTEREVIEFGLRNRVQTIWSFGDESRVVDLLNLDLEWKWFPHAGRDGGGEHAGNLEVDLVFRPRHDLTVLADMEYSFRRDVVEVFDVTVGWAPSAKLQVATGFRRFVDVNELLFAQANWRPSEKWGVEIFSGFDFVEDAFQDQRLTLRRIGPEWVFEIEVSYDFGDDDFGFGIAITPRALFDPRLRARPLRNEPQLASFREALVR